MEDKLRIGPDCEIDQSELAFSFSASGGPGGQHANKAATRVEVRFDIANSPSLTESQRRRLVDNLGDVVRVRADERRSQLRNREAAVERLRSKLVDAMEVKKTRRPTKPSRGAKRRRLEAKKRRSNLKAGRRSTYDD